MVENKTYLKFYEFRNKWAKKKTHTNLILSFIILYVILPLTFIVLKDDYINLFSSSKFWWDVLAYLFGIFVINIATLFLLYISEIPLWGSYSIPDKFEDDVKTDYNIYVEKWKKTLDQTLHQTKEKY